MNHTFLAMSALAAPLTALVASAAEPATASLEKMQQALDVMQQDGVLYRYLKRREYSLQEFCTTILLESMDRCRRGEESIKDSPWIECACTLYEIQDREMPQSLLPLLVDAGAVLQEVNMGNVSQVFSISLAKPEIAAALVPIMDVHKKYAGSSPLNHAIRSTNVNLVKSLLAAGADLNEKNDEGTTPLAQAIGYNRQSSEIARLLLEAGADTNIEMTIQGLKFSLMDIAVLLYLPKEVTKMLSDYGAKPALLPPEMVSCAINDTAAVKKYLDEGGDPNKNFAPAFSTATLPLLAVAAGTGSKEVCEMLLAAGAKAECGDGAAPPLLFAVNGGYTDICRLLLDAGANVNLNAAEGGSSLVVALLSQMAGDDTVQLLLDRGASVNTGDKRTMSPLRAALYTNKTEWVKKLIAAGAETKGVADTLNLSKDDEMAMMRVLLDAGVKFEDAMIDSEDDPFWDRIFYRTQPEVTLKRMMEFGIDLSKPDHEGSTILSAATMFGSTPVVRMLIDAKVNLNTPNPFGVLPVEFAAKEKNFDICRLLIEAGAQLNDEENTGNKVFKAAVAGGNADICKLLVEKGVKTIGWRPLFLAAVLGDEQEVQRLLAAGSKVNAKLRGRTPLMYAARMGQTNVCKLLIAAGADVNAADSNGWTPLAAAAQAGHTDTVTALLAAGADVDTQLSGVPVLLVAINEQHKDTALALLAGGADPNSQHEGLTALHIALSQRFCDELVNKLLAAGAAVNAVVERSGATPLHVLFAHRRCISMNSYLCRKLLAAGADPTIKDKNGDTPENLLNRDPQYSSAYIYTPNF